MNITLDMYQTIAVAVIVLMAGAFLKKRISFLQKFCIPAPVIGGLLFAILTLVLYMTGVAVIDFDDTLKEVCMVFFFTSVGFQANLKVLKSGGKSLIVFLFLVILTTEIRSSLQNEKRFIKAVRFIPGPTSTNVHGPYSSNTALTLSENLTGLSI